MLRSPATAIIGTGGIGSVIARHLASGGETLRLSSADNESVRTLAEIGRAAVVAVDNHDALQGADTRTAGFEPVKIGGIDQSGRVEVGGDLHDLVVGLADSRSLTAGA
jgi:predicted dinucleotide-binding enzyme